ncbi:MAG: cytochrome P450 [Opitutales bacterium]
MTAGQVTDVEHMAASRPPRFYKQHLLVTNRRRFFREIVGEFGDLVYYRGLFDFYIVNHPALVKRVLSETHRNFDKESPIYKRFRNALGVGLVNSEGEAWRRQRLMLQDTFRMRSVQGSFEVIVDCARQLVERLRSVSAEGNAVRMSPEIQKTALQVVGRALFTFDFDPYSEQIGRWTRDISNYSARLPIPVLSQTWSPTPSNFRLKRSLVEFRGFMEMMMEARAKQEPKEDLFGLLLSMRDNLREHGYSREVIADEVLGMIVGGHETTANAIAWALYEISMRPEIRDRILEEIDRLDESFDHSDLRELKFMQAVIDESMRLHPPFWFENRSTRGTVELGAETLTAGQLVVFSRDALHRNPRFWKSPESFDPDRFLSGSEENSRTSYAYVPFGGGPRICIGRHFAMMEIVTVLVHLLRAYTFEYADETEPKVRVNLTIEPVNGLPFKVRPRSN